MGLSIAQAPIWSGSQKWIPIWWRNHLIFGIAQSSDISALYKYKFVLAVYLDTTSGTQIAKIKQPWNGYESSSGVDRRTFFDIKEIVASYVSFTTRDPNETSSSQDAEIHGLGMNNPDKPYGLSNNIVRKIAVKAWVEYATTPNGVPTEDTSDTVDQLDYYQNATYKLPPDITQTQYDLDSDPLDDYDPNSGGTGKLLTDADYTDAKVNIKYDFDTLTGSAGEDLRFNTTKYVQFINQQDRATIAYRPDTYYKRTAITVYYSSGSDTDYITSETATGGSATVTSDDKRIIHFGCGPRNLQSISAGAWGSGSNTISIQIASGNWYYYTIHGESTAGTDGTEKYYFVNGKYADDNMGCNIWNRPVALGDNTTENLSYIRLGWINSLGTWDYFNFACKNTERIEIKERIDMQTPRGVFNEEYYSEWSTAQTNRSLGVSAKRVMTLNTGYISDGEGKFLQWLLKSPLVHFIGMGEQNASGDNNISCPVKVKTSTLTKKTKLNDGVKTNYSFDIEFIEKEPVVAR